MSRWRRFARQHGAGSIRRLGEQALPGVEVISTGSIALDEALGIGGLPRGRVIELFGPESSGKTIPGAACRWPGAEARGGGRVSSTPSMRLTRSGRGLWGSILTSCWSPSPIMVSRRWLSPRSWSNPGQVGIIVIDSVAALVPKAEMEGEMGASHVGLQARMMSQALRKLTAEVSRPGPASSSSTSSARRSASSSATQETQPGRQGAEVLLQRPDGYPAHRRRSKTATAGRQPGPGEGGEEQVRPRRSSQAEFTLRFGDGHLPGG